MPIPMVAIIGRPNVGKSTLFNRLLRRRISIEDNRSGVTRDRISAEMDWNGCRFTIVDTGGLLPRGGEVMDRLVSSAAEAAISQADKIIFVVDGRVDPTEIDAEIALMIMKRNIPCILAVTKIDTPAMEAATAAFYSLGLGDPIGVSGVSGLNSGDLLDRIVEGFSTMETEPADDSPVSIALLGRPNVGKSSIVNKLIGREQQIVSNIPGTTRDAIDLAMNYQRRKLKLVDTAGLRRKKEMSRESLEYYTILRTIKAIDRCEVAVVIMDAESGLTQYDRRLLDDARQKKKGLVAVFNKWDLLKKETGTLEAMEKEFRFQLPDLGFVPLLFTSALTGQRVRKILDVAIEVYDQRIRRISTSALNDFLTKVVEYNPPPSVKGRWLRIKYASQVAVAPPRFAFFMNYPDLIPENYKRYLERRLREEYGFQGVPFTLAFRKK